MKKFYILIFGIITLILFSNVYSQSCCGGSFYDLAVLSLDKKALFNAGFNFDNNLGIWDQDGKWLKTGNTSWQMRPAISGAYRFDNNIQAGLTIPYIVNRNEIPGLTPNGSGIGDITLSGRYEFFHEYQRFKTGERYKIDTKKPYLALTAGIVIPTGRSDETALTEAEVTGKGFYSTQLGMSCMKSLVKDKFQVALDLSWMHSFTKSFDKLYGVPQSSQTSQQGERFNYGLSLIYLLNYWNAASVSFGGFSQGSYKLDGDVWDGTNQNAMSFSASYSYYPNLDFRITPSLKWILPSDNFGTNTTGSMTYVLNVVYYIERY